MRALGAAYRHSGTERDDSSALNREIVAVQAQVSRSLPKALQMGFEESLLAPPTDRDIDIRQHELIAGFANPAAARPREDLLRWVGDAPAQVGLLLGRDGRSAVVAELDRDRPRATTLKLRDLHAAAIHAGLWAAPRGQSP